MLPAGNSRMTSPMRLTGRDQRGTAPSLLLAGTHLIVGFRVGPEVVLRAIDVSASTHPFGVQDGPDGFPPARQEGEGGSGPDSSGVAQP